MTQTNYNGGWSHTLVDQLVQLGVEYFCIAPGLRSSALVTAVAKHPKTKRFVHFDERGLGFHALGYAKATKKPAAVIVTSGTAVGNLLPAVMEAFYDNVPLLLLTCDRPHSLRDTMANQTADQTKIFGQHVRYFFDLPTAQGKESFAFLSTTLARALSATLYPLPGPAQINCPFEEPFFSKEPATASAISPPLVDYPSLSCDSSKWSRELESAQKGVFVIGSHGGSEAVLDLAEKLGWPVIADVNSSIRHLAHPQVIPYCHHILDVCEDLDAELVVQFGDALASKFIRPWMANQPRVIHVAFHALRCDPNHCVSDRVICPPDTFAKQLLPQVKRRSSEWFEVWREKSNLIEMDSRPFSEPSLFMKLSETLTEQSAFYIGNSMPTRDADRFFFPKKPTGPLYANRGLSGIDGQIATMCGIAQTTPVVGVIGDQTALHDLNSLCQLKTTPYPIHLIVINNGGGGIFSFVEVGKQKEVLDPYFAAEHTWRFDKAAEMFDLPYFYATSWDELFRGLETKHSCLIEMKSCREENHRIHKEIQKDVRKQIEKKELIS